MALKRMNRKVGPVWTKRSTSTKAFFGTGASELTSDIKNVLVQLQMENSTGDVTVRPACRYSDSGDGGWATSLDIGTETLAADGELNSTTWNALPGTPRLHVEFGVHVYNTQNALLEHCLIAMRVEKRTF